MTEELSGHTLADHLDERGKLPLGEGLMLLDALARLVGEIHANGAADGALSPARIVALTEGRIALVPAGVAPTWAEADEYLAPEQRDGSEADARADVYALGVIAYRMLMGVLPYSAGDDPIDPHAYVPNLTDRVRRTLGIAVQKDPAERFADAPTFRAALRGAPDPTLDGPMPDWSLPDGDAGAAG